MSRESRAIWLWAVALTALAFAARLAWVLAVPTVPVSDFAMYRESANYLSEFGRLDPGFIYMPGFVALLAAVQNAGGDLFAQKMLGVLFGTLAAAAVFVLVWKLLDRGYDPDDEHDQHEQHEEEDDERKSAVRSAASAAAARWRRFCPCPFAACATLGYALWPAGVAAASVVGTDVPAASLLLAALALLAALGPRRPWAAALAFGAVMGLGAWVRAVALPLSALAIFYWLGRRQTIRRAATYTAAGLAATLVVLLPWGIRHLRQSGALYFTDEHGGITALIGSNPNSEGTYTRALNREFKDVTSRSVLDEPHHQTDGLAYGIAREWLRFEPRYALGLAALRVERLFDLEERLLYWPIFRPGVLVGRPAAWFAAHHDGVAGLADELGYTVLALDLLGLAAAAARRRWTLLALLPFQLALAATYTIFFAEPRYRLPIEMLAFPFVALALGELGALAAALARRSKTEIVRAARALGPGLALLVLWRLGWPALVDGGRALRAQHRWAAAEATLDGRTRLLLWRPAAPLAATSPLEGAPEGVHLRVVEQAGTRVHLRLGGGPIPAGEYQVRARAALAAGGPARLSIAGAGLDVGRSASSELEVRVVHPGGPLELEAWLSGPPGTSVWIDQFRIVSAAPPPD